MFFLLKIPGRHSTLAVHFNCNTVGKQSIFKVTARPNLLARPRSLPLAVNNLPNEETLAGMWKEKKRRWIGGEAVQEEGPLTDLSYIQAMR